MHPLVKKELDDLKERFPGKTEMTLDEWAVYFGIRRTYASQHFKLVTAGDIKVAYKRVGKRYVIKFKDFAFWLAQHYENDAMLRTLPKPRPDDSLKRTRGYTFY